jgi:hypothetical protein
MTDRDMTERDNSVTFILKVPFFGSDAHVDSLTLHLQRVIRFIFPKADMLRSYNGMVEEFVVIDREGEPREVKVTHQWKRERFFKQGVTRV